MGLRLTVGENLSALRAALRPRPWQTRRSPADVWLKWQMEREKPRERKRPLPATPPPNPRPPESAVAREARYLKQDFFDLMSRAHRPDIVTMEDGSQGYADTFCEAEVLGRSGAVDAAEERLIAFLRDHREELAAHPQWSSQLATWLDEAR